MASSVFIWSDAAPIEIGMLKVCSAEELFVTPEPVSVRNRLALAPSVKLLAVLLNVTPVTL